MISPAHRLCLLTAALVLAGGAPGMGQDSPASAVEAVITTGEEVVATAPAAAEEIDVAIPPPPGAPPAEAPAVAAPKPTIEDLTDAGPQGQLTREKVVADQDAASALALGWAYFEKSQWSVADQWFDHALTFDPANARAAEGLIMSAYRSGDIGGAYKLATAHQSLVPDGRNIVAKAAATSAAQAVEAGDVGKADEIMAHFPADESAFAGVRQSIADRQVQTAVARQEFDQARAIAEENQLDTAAVSRDEAARLLQQATDAREAGKHRESLHYIEKAEAIAPLERSGRRLKAWSLYQNRRFDDSAKQFETLYREAADKDSAEGLTHSLQQSGRLDDLARLNRELGGPLATESDPVLLAAARAEEERQRRESERSMAASSPPAPTPAAEETAPPPAPVESSSGMDTILAAAGASRQMDEVIDTRQRDIPDSSSVSAGGGFRVKTGLGGVDRLRVTHLPSVKSTLVFGSGGNQSLTLAVRGISLESGDVKGSRPIGRADDTLEARTIATETDTLIEPRLAYRLENGDKAFFAEIGSTPLGADIGATAIGALGVEWKGERASAGAQGFSEPVTESLLSYTGMRDPYTGQDWGRVVRSGARVDGALDLGGGWGANGLFELSQLDGEGVVENSAVALNLGLTYDLDIPGFEYVTVGPTFHFESYEKNLSQFTSGHGGYFSPDQLYQGMMGVNFLTETGGSFLAGGFVGVGAQTNEQAASPVLPTAPDGRFYGATSDSSAIFTARLQTMLELNPQWRLGAQAGYAKTAAFDDYAVSVYFSFLFDRSSGGLKQSDFSN
jgi:tetratricopeptide (TPR) repeat protein